MTFVFLCYLYVSSYIQLQKEVLKYPSFRVHNELFGGYEGDLMLKPDDATLNRVRGTFLDFLKREDLEPMKVIFKLSQEFTGK